MTKPNNSKETESKSTCKRLDIQLKGRIVELENQLQKEEDRVSELESEKYMAKPLWSRRKLEEENTELKNQLAKQAVDIKKLVECVEDIANDLGYEDNFVCEPYSDLKYIARQALNEIRGEE